MSDARAMIGRDDLVFLAIVLLVAASLLLTRLDDRLLWQDEAETAVLAQSVLSYGVPTAFDGRNWVSQEGMIEFDPDTHVWLWTPWLQHYSAAASFALLGETTFAARLPFVLFALGTILLTYRLALRVAPDRRLARIATLLLVASVPFLLHSRQCRYYAPLCFFTVLYLLQYYRLLAGERRALAWMVVAGTGLFHSHYVVCAAMLASTAVHAALLFSWDRSSAGDGAAPSRTQHDLRARLGRAAIAWGVTGVLALPFAVRFASHTSGQALPGLARTGRALLDAAYHANQYIFPLVLLIVAFALAALADRKTATPLRNGNESARPSPTENAIGPLPIVLSFVITVAALVTLMPWFFFRYYVPLIALGAILQAWVVMEVWRWRKPAALVLLALLLLTDLVPRAIPIRHAIPAGSVRHLRTGDEDPGRVVGPWARFSPLLAYLHEITHDVDGPLEAVVTHLAEHARPTDRIIATYGDLPLQFHTQLRVVGGLSREDPAPLGPPEWLLVRTHTHRQGDAKLKRWIEDHIDLRDYTAISLPAADTPFENRPDPTYHKFRTVESGLPPVRLMRRNATADRRR